MLRGQFPRQFKGTLPHSFNRAWPHLSPLHSTRVVTPRVGHTLGSFTPKRTFVETAVTQTQEFITALHFITGTPWYITIALVAFGVNLTRLPFFIHARRISQRRSELQPLVHAWYARLVKSTPSTPGKSTTQLDKEIRKKLVKRLNKIYRDLGVQTWKLNGSAFTLPIWLGVMESFRRLCGGPTGLLGALFFKDKVTGSTAIAAQSSAPGSLSNAASTAVDPVSAASISTVADVAVPAATTLEPTLATGGLLWFPDLLVADPYYILPWLLSFAIAANIGLVPTSVKAARELLGGEPVPGVYTGIIPKQRLRRILLICSVAIAPATMDLPAALHLYWICSSIISNLFTFIIRRHLPVPAPSQSGPCKGHNQVVLMPRPEKEITRRGSVFD
ncbi:hypothetical protein MCOR25_003126 [Pyricularia grisea]|uniref:Uncharacterized protein n=1 Tax=Pyricularia grisea TaxID=148305 RepID=A0A6P8B0H9_PYRGI|nr:uncharacterized protein PgNI_07053 [Pyricularia grisea]KAI6374662.1 hypothetical protein MCOR25_003126 [Pyricularia grisea]TLD08331.1 hypothetical protein PgNI_07053 [Pyricularia grisea]